LDPNRGRKILQGKDEKDTEKGIIPSPWSSPSRREERNFEEYFFKGEKIKVKELEDDSFRGIDIALFSGSDQVSQYFEPLTVQAGTVVIDNGEYFRMDPEVLLVVPEINPQDIHQHHGIIANSNCSTTQMMMALKLIYDVVVINKIICFNLSICFWNRKRGHR